MQKAFLCSILVLFVLLTLAIVSSPAKAARLELDEEESTFFISCSVFAYGGAASDSDTYQGSSLSYPPPISPICISAAANDHGSAGTGSCLGWYTDGGDYYGGHYLIWDMVGGSFPYIDEYIAVPAGFSVNMNAEGNLVWEILPITEDEDLDLPVFLHIDFSLNSISVGYSGTNVTYEMGIYDYTFGPETEISGPYYMESHCCPGGQNSTFPEERDLWVVAHFGDSIGLSYNASVSAGTNDPMVASQLSIPVVVVDQFIFAYPLRVFFWDRELPEEVEGACSDGEARISVELDLPYELFPDDENPTCIRLTVLSADGKDNGHLIEEGQDDDRDGYDDTPRIEYGLFTQTWCAPAVFDSVVGASNKAKSREIWIQFELDTDNDGTYDSVFVKHIDLVRPPVVMVHGIWSNSKAFQDLNKVLDSSGFLFKKRADYNNKASFYQNRDVVAKYVDQSLKKARDYGYACSKVDIVAHSMGGLLTKLTNVWNKGFLQKKVRKIITVGTPHEGSPVADKVFEAKNNRRWLYDRMEWLMNFRATEHRDSLSGGAVWNLRTNRAGNSYMPVNAQISGVDCKAVVGRRNDTIGLDLSMWIVLMRILTSTISNDPEIIHNNLFGTTTTDWIVTEKSQTGNLPIYHPVYVSWHCTETNDPKFIQLVIEYLNKEARPSLLFGSLATQETNKVSSQEQISLTSMESTANHITMSESCEPNGSVQIVSPTEGETCTAGQSITISIQGTGDTSQAALFTIFGTSSWADIVTVPWVGEVNVLPDSVGSSAKIYAIGLDADMNMTDQDEVDLVLDTNVVLEDILFGFGDTWYFDFIEFPDQSHQFQLYPLGRFSDGSEYPLSVLENQTTYQSLKECVATVDSNGIITVHSKGQASIVVTNSSITTTVLIEVDTCSVDLDLDGDVDFVDFALFANQWQEEGCIELDGNGGVTINDLAIFTEHWLEGTWHPIPGDINGNSKVDFADFALLANNWLETECEELNNWCEGADFDKNGDVGLTDLAEITEYWLEGI